MKRSQWQCSMMFWINDFLAKWKTSIYVSPTVMVTKIDLKLSLNLGWGNQPTKSRNFWLCYHFTNEESYICTSTAPRLPNLVGLCLSMEGNCPPHHTILWAFAWRQISNLYLHFPDTFDHQNWQGVNLWGVSKTY